MIFAPCPSRAGQKKTGSRVGSSRQSCSRLPTPLSGSLRSARLIAVLSLDFAQEKRAPESRGKNSRFRTTSVVRGTPSRRSRRTRPTGCNPGSGSRRPSHWGRGRPRKNRGWRGGIGNGQSSRLACGWVALRLRACMPLDARGWIGCAWVALRLRAHTLLDARGGGGSPAHGLHCACARTTYRLCEPGTGLGSIHSAWTHGWPRASRRTPAEVEVTPPAGSHLDPQCRRSDGWRVHTQALT